MLDLIWTIWTSLEDPTWCDLDKHRIDVDRLLDLPSHLSFCADLAKAIKKVESYSKDNFWYSTLDNYINSPLFTDWERETYFRYKDELKSKISVDPNTMRYSVQLMKLVDEWKLHYYIFLWEWWYGKVILTFNYSTTPTQLNVLKLWKNSSQRRWWVGNLIDECELQENFYLFARDYEGNDKEAHCEVKVPRPFTERCGWNLLSKPGEGLLSMKYTSGETVEFALILSNYYEDCFSNIKELLLKYRSQYDDEYIVDSILARFEELWIDIESASNSTILRMLNKSDLIYIAKKEWHKYQEGQFKRKFTRKELECGINTLLKVYWKSLSNSYSLSSEIMWAYEKFLQSAKGEGLEHNDLNTSNVMLDYKDGKFIIWLIDFGTAKE